MASVPVGVSLQFAPAAVLPSVVLGLSVGDVLPLPHPQSRPLEIRVDGQPVGRAAVASNGSRLAGIVVSTSLTGTEEGTS
nr:FliM/FliN family flagellar motor C-terminal domain-containing protein [Frigoribacterium sp. CFBP 13712]